MKKLILILTFIFFVSVSFAQQIIRNNQGGFGNDNYCVLLTHASESIYDVNKFDDVSKAGNSGNNHICLLLGTNPPVVSTTQKKFGANSWYFSNLSNVNYIECGSVTEFSDWSFGSLDFSIDFWVYFNTKPSGYFYMFSCHIDADDHFSFYVHEAIQDIFTCYFKVLDNTVENVNANYVVTITLEQWIHFAVVRNGSDFSIYQDGVKKASDTYALSMPALEQPFEISGGKGFTSGFQDVYIDEFRISKGIVRWQRDFTLPNREY